MRKKLIEVALPLEAINKEAAREKSIRHGHPSTLHLWWARRPLAACRAVLFSSLVDDPEEPEAPQEYLDELDKLPGGVGLPPETPIGEVRREKLFRFIEELVKWDNSNNERIIGTARRLILAATEGNPPPVLDPFCGGGSIPLEAQRLGLEAHGSDLNPVAVLITKALIEIPPKFAGQPPVNPEARRRKDTSAWPGATGLADDVRYYGQWMRDEAEKRIGHLYPKVKLPQEQGGGEATVIAWLWARTVKCPNPACGAQMPLVRSFALSTKKGKEAWVEPIVDPAAKTVRFEVRAGKGTPPEPPKTGRGAKFRCLVCGNQAPDQHIKDEGTAGRMGAQLMALVAEANGGRVYVAPSDEQVATAESADPAWAPEAALPDDPRNVWCVGYGLRRHSDLYTPRQLVALTTFCDLVAEARERVRRDAIAAGLIDEPARLAAGGAGGEAYAGAVGTYLACAVSRGADFWSTLATWTPGGEFIGHTFSRQALPMVWDFVEGNPLSDATGNWSGAIEWVTKVLAGGPAGPPATADQLDAASAVAGPGQDHLVCTDPPYYDNIGYADLSDFFYVWLRRTLGKVYPDLFATLLAPKAQELVANPYRFEGDRDKASRFFEEGMGRVFRLIREAHGRDFPVTFFYAFKQAKESDEGTTSGAMLYSSTGWETMLYGLLEAGFTVDGTWPMRTERPTGLKVAVNALASSIVLVCRPRPDDAPMATRREFTSALRRELPPALTQLTHAGIAPVDLAQATIGPGMAVFSRYSKVLEADGSPMTVRTALQVINQALDAYLTEQEGDLDGDTRFCIAWFEQYGLNEAPFGEADVLARAKNSSVAGIEEAGVLHARAGKVRLRQRCDYPEDWDPQTDRRLTVWECAQHLICELERSGEEGAAALVRRLGGGMSEDARALAYRLYAIADRKHWTEEARAYNSLVVSWPAIVEKAARAPGAEQGRLLE
jgi:putative DNA methylase